MILSWNYEMKEKIALIDKMHASLNNYYKGVYNKQIDFIREDPFNFTHEELDNAISFLKILTRDMKLNLLFQK